MFCQACGSQVKEDLRYCNRCGARVNYALTREETTLLPPPGIEKTIKSLSILTGIVSVTGLLLLISLVIILLDKGRQGFFIFAMAAVFSLFSGFISFLLIRQLSKVIDASLGQKQTIVEDKTPQIIEAGNPTFLPPMREPAVSVVEHTTRSLEEVPR